MAIHGDDRQVAVADIWRRFAELFADRTNLADRRGWSAALIATIGRALSDAGAATAPRHASSHALTTRRR